MTNASNGSAGTTPRGRFITFEGGEGAGKSTQVRRLVARLENLGIDVLATREPGGSAKAEALREVLLSGAAARFGARGEAILFSAARIDHVDNTIEPALAEGTWVVSDRFADSTRAYQGSLGKLQPRFILELERIAVANARPDLTILLDIPPEAGLLRVSQRRNGEPADRFEAEGLQFHAALRKAFRDIANAEPERCVIVNALAPEDEVADAVWREVETRLLDDASRKPRRARRKDKAEERA